MVIGQLVFGPAGSGKTTYCSEITKIFMSMQEKVCYINLDPSTKREFTNDSIDIRNLISSNDVMHELSLGPNGSLIFCMEFLMDNLFWLKEQIDNREAEYFLFDIPGQIELFTHQGIVRELISFLDFNCNIVLNGLYAIDSHFISDTSKFISVSICGLSLLFSLEIPHENVITKTDLVGNLPSVVLRRFFNLEIRDIKRDISLIENLNFRSLIFNLLRLLEDFSMIKYIPLDITNTREMRSFFRRISNKLL